MRLLFIGDLMGRPGRKLVAEGLPALREAFGPFDFVVANGENAAGGFGLTEKIVAQLFDLGVDCLTSGNHIWDKRDYVPHLMEEDRVLRPANYPDGCPGSGVKILEKAGLSLAVVNLQGRVFMADIDCPFRVADALLAAIEVPCIFVDFHAEASSEKRALGLYLDGRVSAVVGTHTHIQTADEEILHKGTAYLTDVGMTGGHGGVIGMEAGSVLSRFLTAMPTKFEICERDLRLNGVVVDIDDDRGLALDIRRVIWRPE